MNSNDERIRLAKQIADGDEDVCLLTIQYYRENDELSSPRIAGYCLRQNLAKSMVAMAHQYTENGVDVLVGYIDGRAAQDDDWNELFEFLAGHKLQDDVDAVALLRAQMDAPGRPCAPYAPARLQDEEWENIALDPTILEAHGGAQPTGSNAAACTTCGGTGQVQHPVISNYYGDCPDCGDNELLM